MGRLHELCRKGNDTTAVSKQIEGGADVNEQDGTGGTPLHYASRYGNTAVVTVLLDAGASINPTNQKAQSPLYHAVVGQFGDVVKILLERGADPNIQTAAGYFALHFAAREGLSGITKSLLRNKAEPEAKTVEGQTPHALAVKYAKTTVAEIIKQFIETGSYEGVDAIALEAEDDEDAELMRELNDLEVQPTAHMATRVAEIRPPGYKEGDTSGKSGGSGGSGGSGVANNTPKPGAIKAPTKDEDVDGFGKVYVGNAPAPHQLQQGGAAKSAGKHTHNGPEVTTAPAKPEYSVPVKSNGSAKVVEPTQTYDSYDGLMGAKDGTEQYDNAEANTKGGPKTDGETQYSEPAIWDAADPRYSVPAPVDTDPTYASAEDMKGSAGSKDMASFLAELGLAEKCTGLADEAGIDTPDDFKMFSEEELVNEHNFKVGHIRKIFNALG